MSINYAFEQEPFIDTIEPSHGALTGVLEHVIRQKIQTYFYHLEGASPANLYEMLIFEVERPLLQEIMYLAQGNQSEAARWLGMSRATLKKKMQQHDFD